MAEEGSSDNGDRSDNGKPPVQLAVANGGDGGANGTARTNGRSTTGKKGASRPSVVSLSYPDKKSLLKAYMPFLKGGGLFLPTTGEHEMSDEIFLLVTLPEVPKPIPVPGTVVWKTPAGALDGKQQGVGIEFKGREGNSLRARIEGLVGAKVRSATSTHTM